MPSRLASPVLSVSITDIAKVDTTNVDNLFTMWTSTFDYPWLTHIPGINANIIGYFPSILKVCRLIGTWTETGEPELATMEPGDFLL